MVKMYVPLAHAATLIIYFYTNEDNDDDREEHLLRHSPLFPAR